jgi:tetratricopeptide (TPR) repeat protein
MDNKQADIPVWRVFVAAAERARNQGMLAEVESLYMKAVDLAHRSEPPCSKDIGGILLRLADFQIESGELEAAESTYLKAIESFENNDGGSVLLAAALSKLAETYERKGEYVQSEQAWKRVKLLLSEQLKSMLDE